MKRPNLAVIAAALILVPPPNRALAAEPSFRALDFFPYDVSFDGSVVVGERLTPIFGSEPVRWTADGGTVGLGHLRQEPRGGRAVAVSADGATVVGTSNFTATFSWTAEGGLVDLGFPAGATPTDVSGDGAIIVTGGDAFRWTRGTGFTRLDGLSENLGAGPTAISADGSVIVGWSVGAYWEEAVRWTPQGITGLGVMPEHAAAQRSRLGTAASSASGVSADGSVVVGGSSLRTDDGNTSSYDDRAFRWTAETGMVALSWDQEGYASAVSADGSVIVGRLYDELPLSAFVWEQASGMRSLRAVLGDFGIDVSGWQLTYPASPLAISGDGLTIVGTGIDPSGQSAGWMATIPEPAMLPWLASTGLLLTRRRATRISRHSCHHGPSWTKWISLPASRPNPPRVNQPRADQPF